MHLNTVIATMIYDYATDNLMTDEVRRMNNGWTLVLDRNMVVTAIKGDKLFRVGCPTVPLPEFMPQTDRMMFPGKPDMQAIGCFVVDNLAVIF